jgi:hypothetical protein
METFYLQIEVQKTVEELLEGQEENITLELDTEQEVRDAAQGLSTLLFYNRRLKAYLIINRHSAAGNQPCTKELIYEQ